MSLQQQLKSAAEPWLAAQTLAPERAEQLAVLVKRRARRRWLPRLGGVAAVAMLACMGVFWPVVVSLASGVPLVGPYIASRARFDQGAYWADQKGYVVPVGKAASGQGYTFRVESVMSDAARTVVYYTVEGPNLKAPMHPPELESTFNMMMHPDQGWSGGNEVVDGRIVGHLDMQALPLPTTLVRVSMQSIAGVRGNWSVSFLASRIALDQLARAVNVGQRWQGDGYDLTVRRVLLAPTETVVELDGSAAAGFEIRGAELSANGKVVPGGPAFITIPTHGVQPVKYTFRFDRLEGQPDLLTLRLTDVVRWRGPDVTTHPGGGPADPVPGPFTMTIPLK